MKINLCKDCLYYDDCMKDTYPYDFPIKLKERLYGLFVEGYDCFIRLRDDEE